MTGGGLEHRVARSVMVFLNGDLILERARAASGSSTTRC